MHKKQMNRLLAAVLSIMMILSLVVIPAGAARPMGGTDVAETPVGEDVSARLSVVSHPVVNTEPAAEVFAAGATEVDVWDFGAEQLANTAEYTFNNHLNVEVINSWYEGMVDKDGNPVAVKTGQAGNNFPSTGMPNTAGLSYSTAGAFNHRLRTDNTALTRDSGDTSTGDAKDPYVTAVDSEGNPTGATYKGLLYSNSAANPAVHFALECQAGDTVTVIVASNGTDSLIQFSKAGAPAANPEDPAEPDVVEASDVFTRASRTKAQTMVFHAKETGTYKINSVNEKLVVDRIYREHAVDVAVSGKVTEADGMPAGYSLVFTNTTTGAETAMAVSQGAYSGTLKAPYSYDVSLKDANGFAVLVGTEITVEKTDAKVKHNVITQGVDRFTVSGAITGLDAAAAAKLAEGNLLFTPTGDGIVYVPKAAVTVAEDGSVSYTVEVEKDMPVSISAKKLNDWEITTADVTDKVFTADTTLDLAFAKKAVWPVTITTTGMTAADLAGTKFTFTNLHEAGETEDQVAVPFNPYSDSNLTGSIYNYAYTFTGTTGVELRDGVYDVTVDDPHQKATANLVVNGAAANLTIPFKTPAPHVSNGVHDFTPAGVTLAMVDGISGDPAQFKPHNSGHGLAGKGDITVSLAELSNITISGCCFSQVGGTMLVPTATVGGQDVTVEVVKAGVASSEDPEYAIKGVEGDVVITFPATGTSYIHKITVEAAVMPTIAADDYKFGAFEGYAQGDAVTSPVDGLAFGGSAKWWNTSDGMKFDNGTMTVNMKEKGTITVTGCTYSGDKTLASVTSDVGTVTLDESGSDPVYTIADAEGLVTITLPNNNTYIHGIKVEYANAGFEVPVSEWNFNNNSLPAANFSTANTAATDWEGLQVEIGATGKFAPRGESAWAQFNAGAKLIIPIYGGVATGTELTISVNGYSAGDVKIGEWTNTTAQDYEDHTITVDESHTVVIEAGNSGGYIGGIKVNYPEGTLPEPEGDIVYHVGASRTADGVTEFTTITDALAAAEQAKRAVGQRITIEIDPGNYEEQLYIKVKDLTLKNAKANQATLELKNKGVDIGDNEVRITWYYGHGYNYYSMTNGHRYNADVMAANQANGYPSYKNAGAGSTDDSYWNASVLLAADNFQAEGIIFENSFNQYVSAKSVLDTIEPQGAQAKEGNVARASMKTVGDTKVQEKAYVERAGALSIKSGSNIFFNKCAFISRQDTFYGAEGSKVACYDCDIYGGTDYIYGGMTLVAAKCDLLFNTSEDNNDVGYITAAQQKSQRGYLMWNCTVDSTTPGVNTASAYRSKPGYFGRPWESTTGEAVFYATDIKATDPVYFGVPLDKQTEHSTSLITPVGWNNTLGGESAKSAELGSVEFYDDVNNTAKRVSWATVPTQAPTVADFLGDWDPFTENSLDMTISNQTPTAAPAATKPVTTVKITTTPKDLNVGEKLQLAATVTPSDATDPSLDWTSSDLSVATVSETGEVTAVAGGVVDITASSKNHMVNDHIRLTVIVPVSGVTLNKTTINMGAGRTTTLTATVAPDNATNKDVTWKSSDEAVVTVDATGKVRGVNEGTATITVTTADGEKTAQCAVTIVGTVPVAPPDEPIDPNGAIVILHSNDVHGVVATIPGKDADGKDIKIPRDGYAKMAQLKADYEAKGATVLVMDAGDFSQGTVYVSASQGATAVELMNLVGYDLAATGNHEFDYGAANLDTLATKANFDILAGNIMKDGQSAYTASVMLEAGDKKIGVFGLATPETATKAHPAKIQGLSFLAEQELFTFAQEQVNALTADGANYIICLGHLGIDAESTGNRSVDLLTAVDGIDVFIDGHSHSTLDDIEAATDASRTVNGAQLTSTGTKFANIGVVTIGPDGTITTECVATDDITLDETNTKVKAVMDKAAEIEAEVDADYGAKFATSSVDLNGDKAPGNRTEETNLGDLITDAMLWLATKDDLGVPTENVIALTNGGGIRAPIAKGDVTKKDVNTVLPFGNTVAVDYVKGSALLEALEASTYCTPTAVGGFPQVAGITFTVDTTKAFDAGEKYPGTTYDKPASINRVTINAVNGKAFDPDAEYAVVTNDFVAAGGDTYYALSTSPKITDTGVPLDEALMDYITTVLKGTIGSDYAEPQGRITVITAENVDATLADVIKAAEAEIGSVKISTDGKDINRKDQWVTQAAWDAYNEVIQAAKDVAASTEATAADKIEMINTLNEATAAFKALEKAGNKKGTSSGGTPAYGTGTNPDGTEKPATETKTNANGDVATIDTYANGDKTITVVNKDGETVAEISLPATIAAPATKFVDVPDDHWAAKSINDMAGLGMVKGVNEANDVFDMNSSMTRGAVATMFFRLSNGKSGLENTFADVQGHWAADAVAWASKTGVVNGYSAEAFGPDDAITRQQLAVMLCRFANLIGMDTKAHSSALDSFTDADQADAWATDSLAWCVETGVMKGRGNDTLDPLTNITRTEATVMFDRMIGLVK